MLFGDYHTHTVYSHGKGSVEDNVRAAIKKGLREIAITDHGFSHMVYNLRRSDFAEYIADIEACRKLHPEIKIYSGIEANLVSDEGEIDLLASQRGRLDLVLCGYHKLAVGDFWSFFTFTLPRLLPSKNSAKMIARNTDAFIRAMENSKIDIISHPNTGANVDMLAVGEAAKEFGVFLELNGKRPDITDEDILALVKIGCEFIVNSDAHSDTRVGEVSKPMEIAKRLDIFDNIANWNKAPNFRGMR